MRYWGIVITVVYALILAILIAALSSNVGEAFSFNVLTKTADYLG